MGSDTDFTSRVHSKVFDSINESLPDGVKVGFGTVYLYRTHESGWIERVSETRAARTMSKLFTPVLFLTMLVALGLFAFETVDVLTSPGIEPTPANDPKNMIAVPGVNAFLPMFAGIYILIGLLSCGVVHEAAHALAMVIEDVELEEYGIGLLLLIPLAAYVLPDEEAFESISSSARIRVFSAGVFANIALTVVTTIWFVLPWTGDLITAFLVYFAPVFGGPPPTPETVGALGAVTNTVFWVWFFNLNIGLLNALPIAVLDGGRIAGELGETYLSSVFPTGRVRTVTVAVTSVMSLSLFVVALFGPYFV